MAKPGNWYHQFLCFDGTSQDVTIELQKPNEAEK